MFSRAHLLIQQQINEAENEFKIATLNETLFEIIAVVNGPKDSLWEKGVFQIYFKFDENYNMMPPMIWFLTIPFHPNIDQMSGSLNLDFIDSIDKWKQLDDSKKSIRSILYSIQHLLNNPLLDRAINIDAVFMLKNNPKAYERIILQSVNASIKLDTTFTNTYFDSSKKEFQKVDKENLASSNTEMVYKSEHENLSNNRKIADSDLSLAEKNNSKLIKKSERDNSHANFFNSYMIMWRDIATAKSSKMEENKYFKDELLPKPYLLQQHLAISLQELDIQLNQQLADHRNLMYGNMNFKNSKFQMNNQKIINYKQESLKHSEPVNNKNESKDKNQRNLASNAKQKSQLNRNKFETKKDNREILSNAAESEINEKFDDEEVDDLIKWSKAL